MSWGRQQAQQAFINLQGKRRGGGRFMQDLMSFAKPVEKTKEVPNCERVGWAFHDYAVLQYVEEHPMRMWMVAPRGMCRQHLLGEHAELHMFVGSINKGISLEGYRIRGFVEVHRIVQRHQELADELVRRGYKHSSPLPKFEERWAGYVDYDTSIRELHERCDRCRSRFHRHVLRKPLRPKIKYRSLHVIGSTTV